MSKYDPLRKHLLSISSNAWQAAFADIEAVLGFSLPSSARRFSAWWANQDPPLSQTLGWVDAGWQTMDVDIVRNTVTFRRRSISNRRRFDDYLRTLRWSNAEGIDIEMLNRAE